MVGAITDAKSLQQHIIDGIDDVLSRPFFSRFLSDEARRLLKTQREFWRTADAATLDALYRRFLAEG